MRIAIIGAGWAGLAAAIKLQQNSHQVHMFESAGITGGRARAVKPAAIDTQIDNGQHILIGAYENCFKLMHDLGINVNDVLQRYTLNIESADQSLKFGFYNLPAPFNQLGVFFKSKGIAGVKGRLFFARLSSELRKNKIYTNISVTTWFKQMACPPELITKLFEPLCIATTNTDINSTDANIFANVLRDSLLRKASDSDIYIPKLLLEDIWSKKATENLGSNIQRKLVREIAIAGNDKWLVEQQEFDRLIIATPYDMAKKLIASLPDADSYLKQLPDLAYSAIGTLSLQLEMPWSYKPAISLLFDQPDINAWGQWLFNRNAVTGLASHKNLVHVVIGRAQRYAGIDTEIVANGVIQQVKDQSGVVLPRVLAYSLVTEKRATFDVVPGLVRPSNSTRWDGLFFAGDWTDTGYPAVLEGAVISGITAASLC